MCRSRNKRSCVLSYALSSALVLGVSGSATAGFLGDQVWADLQPEGGSDDAFWGETPDTTTVVDPGIEFIFSLQGSPRAQLDLTDLTIELTWTFSNFGLGANEVLTLSDLDFLLPAAPAYSVTSAGGVTGIEAGDVSISGSTLTWDLNNTRWDQGSTATITFVPEPAGVALLGFGALGLLRRRR